MDAYIVHLERLPALFDAWAKNHALSVPAATPEGFYEFLPWDEEREIAWDYDMAYNPPKRFVMPPKEPLVAFDLKDLSAQAVFEAPAQIVFGMHPYDVKALSQLDQLMDAGFADQYYLKRREATVVMALTPQSVAETAFWASVGAEEVQHGYDLYWTKIGPASFLVEVGSPQGEALLHAVGAPTRATVGEKEAARRAKIKVTQFARRKALAYNWEETPRLLAKSWDSPLWRKNSETCLACGSCNLVCPTCYCFDLVDEVDDKLQTGVRSRTWDGCMLTSFAVVAGNHNFRPKALDRYRHRYFRKGKYIYDKIGELGCVGCGRCVRACTANIANPLAVFNALWEESTHAF